MFGNEKWKIHSSKNSIKINKADINKIVIFNNFSIGKKVSQYFIDPKVMIIKLSVFLFLLRLIIYLKNTMMKSARAKKCSDSEPVYN